MNELLRRTAAEIRRCRGVVVQLEDAVHALIDTSGARVTSGPLADLQAIDLLDQRLHDLALWTEALAHAAGDSRADRSAQDLGKGLLLAEMRSALTGLDRTGTGVAGHTEVF
ncbi:MAG: hypothetical protein WBP18_13030 [Paracoccaceae bacterium]|jgi:hypothetical protein